MAGCARRVQTRVGDVLRRDGVAHAEAPSHIREGVGRQRGRRLLRRQMPSTRIQPRRAAVPTASPRRRRHHGAGQTAHGPDRRHHLGVRTRARRAAGAPGRSRRLDRRAGCAKLTAGQPRGRDAVLDERRVEIHAAQGDVHTAE